MRYLDQIIWTELVFEATRSGGPGGQHVNKTSSAIILRWNVLTTQSFNYEKKQDLIQGVSKYLTNTGDLVIRSEEFRSQESNKKRCLEKLEQILESAFFKAKVRKKSRPTRSSIRKNKERKKQHSDKKILRKKVNHE